MIKKTIILTEGKYKGKKDLPIGIYRLKVISGNGLIRCEVPDRFYAFMRSNDNNVYPNLKITKKSELIIGASITAEFTLIRELPTELSRNHSPSFQDRSALLSCGSPSSPFPATGQMDSLCAGSLSAPDETPTPDFDHMEGHKFEHFCAELLKKNGFEGVEVTQGSGDFGIDILACREGISYAIQCKCYTSDIGPKAIQEACSGREHYHCMIGAVLTNRSFTKAAKELAQTNNILLWDRKKLLTFVHNL